MCSQNISSDIGILDIRIKYCDIKYQIQIFADIFQNVFYMQCIFWVGLETPFKLNCHKRGKHSWSIGALKTLRMITLNIGMTAPNIHAGEWFIFFLFCFLSFLSFLIPINPYSNDLVSSHSNLLKISSLRGWLKLPFLGQFSWHFWANSLLATPSNIISAAPSNMQIR